MDETFNMDLRKFLKQVGVTSQKAIEDAVRAAGAQAEGKQITLRMHLTSEDIGLDHRVEGSITGPRA